MRIAAADPLNLTGMVLPGPRIPAVRDRSFELVDGALAGADAAADFAPPAPAEAPRASA